VLGDGSVFDVRVLLGGEHGLAKVVAVREDDPG
jgi:hypothetical protein